MGWLPWVPPSPPPHTGKSAARNRGPLLPKDGRHPQVLMALAQPPDYKQRQCIRRGQCLQGSGEHKWVPTWCCTHPPTPLCQAAAREKGHFLPDKYKGFKCADEAHTSPTGMHLVAALFKEEPALEWGGRNGEEVPALRLPSFHPCSTSLECQRHFAPAVIMKNCSWKKSALICGQCLMGRTVCTSGLQGYGSRLIFAQQGRCFHSK